MFEIKLKLYPYFFVLQSKKPFLIFKRLYKAVGVCSLKPNGKHLLLFDCDNEFNWKWFKRFKKPFCFYRSKSGKGFHVIVLGDYEFEKCLAIYKKCPFVDKRWVDIGRIRGYWFLETVFPIVVGGEAIPYMRIERCVK